MDIISATLAPSKTYPKANARAFTWAQLAGELHVGTLTIEQGRRDLDSYRVAEDTDPRFPLARVFLLAKQDAEGDVYAVTVGHRVATCTCDGFRFKGTCKHRDSVLALLEGGAFDPCPTCAGHGYVPNAGLGANPCPACHPAPTPHAAAVAA